ncbi:MAG: PfkB family carbohydrate kinase [Acidobacteriota bacterium]|jgi:rfaE bifunctional protein kinase chain/domain
MVDSLQMRDRLLRIVDQFSNRRLAVAGDLIADQFLYGQTSRVSREAPVLVLQYRDLIRVPGGAANAANNLLDLGCHVMVIGAVGPDAAGTDLISALKEKGADIRNITQVELYSTPVKTRILAGAHHSSPQQIVRVDRESRLPVEWCPPWNRLRRSFRTLDGIIISDYGYGAAEPSVLQELKRLRKDSSTPLVVDSRFRMAAFQGVTSMTPNITELEASEVVSINGDQQLLRRVARRVLRKQRLGSLLVTQGRFGMMLFQPRRAPVHIPIYGTDEVADVTGAGDTVIAVFTLSLACGGSPEDSARLANYAGGIVVMKRGTATVNREELFSAVRQDLSS